MNQRGTAQLKSIPFFQKTDSMDQLDSYWTAIPPGDVDISHSDTSRSKQHYTKRDLIFGKENQNRSQA